MAEPGLTGEGAELEMAAQHAIWLCARPRSVLCRMQFHTHSTTCCHATGGLHPPLTALRLKASMPASSASLSSLSARMRCSSCSQGRRAEEKREANGKLGRRAKRL